MTTFKLGGYYLETALSLAHASCAAYENDLNNYEGFQNFHFKNVIPFASARTKDNEATRGFLAEREDAIVLAFRGSDDSYDWRNINPNCGQIFG